MKREGMLWRFAKLRQVKFLNNIVEQDHRRIKRLTIPRLGFKSLWRATIRIRMGVNQDENLRRRL
jgi:transposase-like protein